MAYMVCGPSLVFSFGPKLNNNINTGTKRFVSKNCCLIELWHKSLCVNSFTETFQTAPRPDGFQTCSRQLQDTLYTPFRHFKTLSYNFPGTFKTPSRHFPEIYKTLSRHHPENFHKGSKYLQNTFQTFYQD